jgi:hypothetical protein
MEKEPAELLLECLIARVGAGWATLHLSAAR